MSRSRSETKCARLVTYSRHSFHLMRNPPMKNIKTLAAIASLSAAAGFAGSAAAQPSLSSVYIGGTVGQAEFKDGCQGLAGCDKKDTADRKSTRLNSSHT